MLRIIRVPHDNRILTIRDYSDMLCKLAIAEASMIKNNSKALDHFIAIVKELERIYGFKFEEYEEPSHKKLDAKSDLDIQTNIDLDEATRKMIESYLDEDRLEEDRDV